jgi:hypothetical protein
MRKTLSGDEPMIMLHELRRGMRVPYGGCSETLNRGLRRARAARTLDVRSFDMAAGLTYERWERINEAGGFRGGEQMDARNDIPN